MEFYSFHLIPNHLYLIRSSKDKPTGLLRNLKKHIVKNHNKPKKPIELWNEAVIKINNIKFWLKIILMWTRYKTSISLIQKLFTPKTGTSRAYHLNNHHKN